MINIVSYALLRIKSINFKNTNQDKANMITYDIRFFFNIY